MSIRIIVLLCFYIITFFTQIQRHCNAQCNYPADISFCIADLKFDGQNIKICEFGQGSRSKFKGHDALYGKGKIWTELWKYLATFQKPFWIITPDNYNFTQKSIGLNLKDLQKYNGQLASSLGALENSLSLNSWKTVNKNPSAISSYDQIVVTNNKAFDCGFFANFRSKHPSILITDQVTAFFVNSKQETAKLFDHPDLQKYRPKYILCKCIYDKNLVKTITQKLNCKKYVIKPLNASRGNGVIIIDRLHLDKELKKILIDKNSLNPDDPTYKHWITTKDKNFLVEEFAASKTINIDNKKYDATMRVIFVLSHDMGNINIEYLGAYWKLPSRSLDEYGGLTCMHKSNINKDRKSSAIVDLHDFEIVKKELTKAMYKAYALMLDRRSLTV